jgi:hypothetical protein
LVKIPQCTQSMYRQNLRMHSSRLVLYNYILSDVLA